jgi:hypothetical protein
MSCFRVERDEAGVDEAAGIGETAGSADFGGTDV